MCIIFLTILSQTFHNEVTQIRSLLTDGRVQKVGHPKWDIDVVMEPIVY